MSGPLELQSPPAVEPEHLVPAPEDGGPAEAPVVPPALLRRSSSSLDDPISRYVVRDLDTGEVYALGAEDLSFDTFASPGAGRRRSSSSNAPLGQALLTSLSSAADAVGAAAAGVLGWFSEGPEAGGLSGVVGATSRLCGANGRPGEEIRMADLGVVKTLGRGAFGQVLLVRHRPSQAQFALKIVKLQASGHITEAQLLEEREVLAKMGRCRHPYCAALCFAFRTPDSLYLGMEYLPGGDLKRHLRLRRRLPEDWVRFWGAELVLAIGHLHSLDVVYRDVKPHNCILDAAGHVRLVDFGLSKQRVTDAHGARTLLGTPDYAAPEVLAVGFRKAALKRERRAQERRASGRARRVSSGDGRSSRDISLEDLQMWREGYGKAADWWSVGIMLYELLGGTPPFQARDIRQTYKRILFSKLKFRPETAFSEPARQLLRGLLEKDPADRLGSWSDIPKDIMAQPFFAGMDWDLLMARKVPSPYFVMEDLRPDTPLGQVPMAEGRGGGTAADSDAPQGVYPAASPRIRPGMGEYGPEMDSLDSF